MIYNLRRIRKYFDQDSMKTVIHACITSKLDYCNIWSIVWITRLTDSKVAAGSKYILCKIDL